MAYVLEKIADYNANLQLIITQFQDSEKLKGLISAADDSANDIETALFEIRDEMDLEVAVGVQLDLLGRVFNEARNGLNDTDYRIILKLKAATVYSGEPEAIISILLSSFGAAFVTYHPNYPGKYYVYTDLDITNTLLAPFSPAGVLGNAADAIIDQVGDYIIDQAGDKIVGLS